jgi:hypothetical protein
MTTLLILKNCTFCHTIFVCFVFISEQTTSAPYEKKLFFINKMKSVYCVVRTGSLNIAFCILYLEGYIDEQKLSACACMFGSVEVEIIQ